MAERASRVKDEFVAMVSHELRTPLNAILGWTQLMTKPERRSGVITRGVDVIARNTRLQAQLISDLLDVSRIVSGKLRSRFVMSICARWSPMPSRPSRRTLTRRAWSLNVTSTTTIGPLAGDPARLQQIVWNLLSNAIKFTPDGGTSGSSCVASACRCRDHGH